MTVDEYSYYNFKNYTIASIFCRNTHKNGGVCIYVSKEVEFFEIDMNCFCCEMNCEVVAVLIRLSSVVIVSVYRPPTGCINTFFAILEDILFYFNNNYKKFKVILCGDLDVK